MPASTYDADDCLRVKDLLEKLGSLQRSTGSSYIACVGPNGTKYKFLEVRIRSVQAPYEFRRPMGVITAYLY